MSSLISSDGTWTMMFSSSSYVPRTCWAAAMARTEPATAFSRVEVLEWRKEERKSFGRKGVYIVSAKTIGYVVLDGSCLRTASWRFRLY